MQQGCGAVPCPEGMEWNLPHVHTAWCQPLLKTGCFCCITHGALLGSMWAYPCATDYMPHIFPSLEGLGQSPGYATVQSSLGFVAARGGRQRMHQTLTAGHRACENVVGALRSQPGSGFCGACPSMWILSPPGTLSGEGRKVTYQFRAEE